jgi:D-lyxose ketol-isomerase
MADMIEQKVLDQARELLAKSGFALTPEELEKLAAIDFGLGHLETEGLAFIDILRSERLRITLLILLPNQTLPQHVHPPYENETGKEETLRVLYGQTKVYVQYDNNNDPNVRIPDGKDAYYTARKEIALSPGQQFTVKPGIEHWFQGGLNGAVNICFQNRADETQNLFFDPKSTGCPIKPTDKYA